MAVWIIVQSFWIRKQVSDEGRFEAKHIFLRSSAQFPFRVVLPFELAIEYIKDRNQYYNLVLRIINLRQVEDIIEILDDGFRTLYTYNISIEGIQPGPYSFCGVRFLWTAASVSGTNPGCHPSEFHRSDETGPIFALPFWPTSVNRPPLKGVA